MHLPRTYEKLPWKENHIGFGTDRQRSCYKVNSDVSELFLTSFVMMRFLLKKQSFTNLPYKCTYILLKFELKILGI